MEKLKFTRHQLHFQLRNTISRSWNNLAEKPDYEYRSRPTNRSTMILSSSSSKDSDYHSSRYSNVSWNESWTCQRKKATLKTRKYNSFLLRNSVTNSRVTRADFSIDLIVLTLPRRTFNQDILERLGWLKSLSSSCAFDLVHAV